LIADGCLIENAVIESSLIGLRSIIRKNVTIKNTYVMGADYYETEDVKQADHMKGIPEIGIGEGSYIENAIIDKNARVGRNVTLRNRDERVNYDDGKVVIREGIVVVPRGGLLPDGYSI
jgi:glucose-1-phosphate adenylyltransferase